MQQLRQNLVTNLVTEISVAEKIKRAYIFGWPQVGSENVHTNFQQAKTVEDSFSAATI